MSLVFKRSILSSQRNSILQNMHKTLLQVNKKTFLFTKSKVKDKVLLDENNKEGVKITYYSKAQVSKDSYVLRFLLPDAESMAGFNTCQYVHLQSLINNSERRPYHPISLNTDKGFIDFLIKVYSNPSPLSEDKNNYGLFSNYLANLQEGEMVRMIGPFGKIQYSGNGELQINEKGGIANIKKVTKIGMIAGGTGISPMFQLTQKIISTRFDNTGLSLIYSARHIEDMSLTEDLVKFDRSGRIGFFPVVSQPEIGTKWRHGVGRVTEEMIENFMPSPKDKQSAIIICGPREMIEDHLKPLLRAMAYPDENILTFH